MNDQQIQDLGTLRDELVALNNSEEVVRVRMIQVRAAMAIRKTKPWVGEICFWCDGIIVEDDRWMSTPSRIYCSMEHWKLDMERDELEREDST